MTAPPLRSTRRALAATACLLVAFATHAGPATAQTARAAAAQTLTVTLSNATEGDGLPRGRVTSVPAGIDCPTTCSAQFEQGTPVTLTASPNEGYALAAWSALPNDPRCEAGPRCSVTIPAGASSVQATFQPAAQLSVVPAGPGTMSISPGGDEPCTADGQQLQGSCTQRYVTGTSVTVTARPAPGASFLGWSDFECKRAARTCKLPIAGQRYLSAFFGPVWLSIQPGDFGAVTIVSPSRGMCALMEGTPPCRLQFQSGTLVTLRRERAAAGRVWVGACEGNVGGELDADVCRVPLYADELVGAGLPGATAIPPPLGSGIAVRITPRGRGTVTGKVDGGTATLSCGTRCSISGLTRYDAVRVRATARRGSRFVRWNDGDRRTRRILPLSKHNRVQAIFARRR